MPGRDAAARRALAGAPTGGPNAHDADNVTTDRSSTAEAGASDAGVTR